MRTVENRTEQQRREEKRTETKPLFVKMMENIGKAIQLDHLR